MALEAFPTVRPAELRRRSVANLLRMGHCAPSVMQTMVDASAGEAEWLVKLAAGLPGGIGNTRSECGGLTAPLVVIGLRHGRDETADGLPVAVDRGHDLLQRFEAAHGTTQCRAILGDARLPLKCVGVVRRAPSMCAQCLAAKGGAAALPPPAREAYRELYAHWQERGFHCADAVFDDLDRTAAVSTELRDATTAFMGGTLFTGMTCSALTAGVMALGSALGQIENSRARVLRMIGTMAVGGNAFADELNAFNPVMNLGHELATWFEEEFGSTQCRVLTGCDFTSTAAVHEYIAVDGTTKCAAIAQRVAARVADLLERSSSSEGEQSTANPASRLTAVLFVDIVEATPLALSLGDRAWAELLERYHQLVHSSLARHRGRLMDTAGDGFFAVFDEIADAVRCALDIRLSVQPLGLELRSGVHLGRCWEADEKCAGADVHIGARLASAADPGEILLSEEAAEPVRRAEIEVVDRGVRSLKGLPGSRRVFAVGAG